MIIAACLLLGRAALAAPVKETNKAGLFYEITDERTVIITGGRTEMGLLSVPPRIKNMPVERIAAGAFQGRKDIKKLIVGQDVRYLAEDAFSGCTSLQEVYLENGVQYLGKNVFSGDLKLESVTLPDSVSFIGETAFGNCEKLMEISFPQSAYVDDYAFVGSGWQTERDNGAFRIRGSRLMEAWGSREPVLEFPYGITELEDFYYEMLGKTSVIDKYKSDYGEAELARYEEIILPETMVKLGNGCFSDTNIGRIRVPSVRSGRRLFTVVKGYRK